MHAKLRKPWQFYAYMYMRLPSIAFWRVKLKYIDDERCLTQISLSRRTQNPFKSIYFAAQAGAAELSTGLLCLSALAGRGKWSMLVTESQAYYYKKARNTITFTCKDGTQLLEVLNEADRNGEAATLNMVSEGHDEDGVLISRFVIKWSFARK